MRDAIRKAIGGERSEHFGQAYEMLAPPPRTPGKPDVEARQQWLKRCAETPVSKDYATYFALWKASFPASCLREVTARSRLLIGHGNPSGSDVGLTVHQTWGVPIMPGTALKGLLAHYIDAVYGDATDKAAQSWRGPTWTNGKPQAPGEDFATMFGAPATGEEDTGGQRGWVEFHDALYVPDSATGNNPFALDVLTVHQKDYYGDIGWPSDWDSPNPVGFVSVRPGTRFLLAVTTGSQPAGQALAKWRSLAIEQLTAALAEWGIGGKTAAGYGRLTSR
ncbi:MAG: type III-B CRISPR module RAMP protein Cmr6 [Acetobacteraceae bacterium]